MTNIYTGTRYIAAAYHSDTIVKEWKEATRGNYNPPPPHYNDYALLKVLYMLGLRADVTAGIPTNIKHPGIWVNAFKWEEQVTPLDFSGLKDSDTIFIAGHGGEAGLYAMGPSENKNADRLIDILTGDGNLRSKRKNKKTTILLLSCRAGRGYHKGVARRLYKKLGNDITVGGALGFTFGSMSTLNFGGQNEVLIKGIPWHMEYEGSIKKQEAENETSAIEGKTITIDGKKNEIKAFSTAKKALEDQMKAIATNLKSTEVNKALDEIGTKAGPEWLALVRSQFELYKPARTHSNLEFDMWYPQVDKGYVWANGTSITDQEADALLSGELSPTDDGLTSIK